MTNKQLATLIGSLAMMGLGGAYYSTLTPAQRCLTSECRGRQTAIAMDAENKRLDQQTDETARETRELSERACRDFNIC